MLQSGTLELVNIFCEQVKGVYGIDEFKKISANHIEEFDHCKNLLVHMYSFNKRTRQNPKANINLFNMLSMNPGIKKQ